MLHGYVSRSMWRSIWKGLAIPEVPISYVTNGIHTSSYVGNAFRAILDHYVGPGWLKLPPDSAEWDNVDEIPDTLFWEAKRNQKLRLLEYVRERLAKSDIYSTLDRSQRRILSSNLSPDTLIIGFARRFAPYKRATMLFADPDRLARFLDNQDRPVVILFSGKAHPADVKGIDLIQEVVDFTLDPRFLGKIFFLEDYSLDVSRRMVRGCDVWLNTPRRPYEASGTSGQKVPVNGGLNLSVSDGWWVEGANGHNGWVIGRQMGASLQGSEQNDYADAESLYQLLEEHVLPTYFDRADDDLPHKWIHMAKNSLKTLTSMYSTARMVQEYTDDIYLPAAEYGVKLDDNKQANARKLGEWQQHLSARFSGVSLEEIQVEGIESDTLTAGQSLKVRASIRGGELAAKELCAQLVIGPADGNDFTEKPDILTLQAEDEHATGQLVYSGEYVVRGNGRYAYGIRVLPETGGLVDPMRTNMLLWG